MTAHMLTLLQQDSIHSSLRGHQITPDVRPTVSYFDRLPTELNVEVFEKCMDSFPRFSANAAPLLLCGICLLWRNIAQSSPKLWARFEVRVPADEQNKLKEALGLWLSLSRNNPISFRVIHDPMDHLQDSRLAPVLATLVPHAHRWKDVSFETQSSSVVLLQHILQEELTALRSISINLKGLCPTPFDIRPPSIPWGQLTSLNLSFDYEQLLTLGKCSDILAQCGNLSQCTLNADCVFNPAFAQKISLPRLCQLDIIVQMGPQSDADSHIETAGSKLVSFLEQLELPHLPSFGLQWLMGRKWAWSAEDQSRLISIFRSLSPALRVLSLAYLPLCDQDVLECLQPLQHLTHLDLQFSLADKECDPITDMFLATGTLSSDKLSPNYLPLLESLHIQSHGARCTTLRLMNLIESRWKPSGGDAHLRSFGFISLVPIAGSSAQTREMLRIWSLEGLDISINQMTIR